MPNRIIREGILTSDRVDRLDPPTEVFYRRLLNKVDDHGLYDARPSIIRASLYPLRVTQVRETDCSRWMAACQKAGLIALYSHEGKPYLKVLDTRWQVRAEPKYPLPTDSNCLQVLANEHLDVVVDVVAIGRSRFPEFWQAYPKKVGKGAAEKAWDKIDASLTEKILAAVAAAQWSPETRFIPHPSTWLTEKRWEDEPAEARKRMVI